MKWPDKFINDELWLRARRIILAMLEKESWNQSQDRYREYMMAQWEMGKMMAGKLPSVIGPGAVSLLQREDFLGHRNSGFRRRLNFMLAFGSEYVRALEPFVKLKPQQAEQFRLLSALFNLGIVLVDQITDHPDEFGDVSAIISVDKIRSFVGHASSPDLNGRFAYVPDLPHELQVLGAIIKAFFIRLNSLKKGFGQADKSNSWQKIFIIIESCYKAQMASAQENGDHEQSWQKSLLPFQVMPAVLNYFSDPSPGVPLLPLSELIGEVFWRIDDIVDVGRDFHTEQLNGLLANLESASQNTPTAHTMPLGYLLEEDILEMSVRKVGQTLNQIASLVRHSSLDPKDFAPLKSWISCYLLDWLR